MCAEGFKGGHCQLVDYSAAAAPPPPAGKGNGVLEDGDKRLAVIIAVPLVVVVEAMFSCMAYMVRRERRGAPLFSKLEDIGGATARASGFGNGGSKAVELPVVVGDRA